MRTFTLARKLRCKSHLNSASVLPWARTGTQLKREIEYETNKTDGNWSSDDAWFLFGSCFARGAIGDEHGSSARCTKIPRNSRRALHIRSIFEASRRLLVEQASQRLQKERMLCRRRRQARKMHEGGFNDYAHSSFGEKQQHMSQCNQEAYRELLTTDLTNWARIGGLLFDGETARLRVVCCLGPLEEAKQR